VATAEAHRFVGLESLKAACGRPVATDLYGGEFTRHLELAQSVRAVVLAPVSADRMARMRLGLADDLLGCILLALPARVPLLLAPAMHSAMWSHVATRENLAELVRRGATVVGPQVGRLAGGDCGMGRMAEPEEIVAALRALLDGGTAEQVNPGPVNPGPVGSDRPDLSGRRVLITGGGTREPIDRVRFIGNRSSGRQAAALAQVAADLGAEVILITTAGDLGRPRSLRAGERATPAGQVVEVEVVEVETAAQMGDAIGRLAPGCDVVVMAAAVADFSVAQPFEGKLSRASGPIRLDLVPNPDILADLARCRRPGQVLVGFAAEVVGDSDPDRVLVEKAREKLRAKGVDLIVANPVDRTGVGFGSASNEAWIVGADGACVRVPRSAKEVVAEEVWRAVASRLARIGPAGVMPK
jgi:phosphopantothenoylcysteine decarboxylase/phosphopantothenate--cysteine ligase